MLRIEYHSVVSLTPDDLGLLDIVRECDALDRDKVVTGFLHYDGKRFHQVMEGPEHVLTAMFEALRWDLRHEKVQISDRSIIETREHSGFSFQYVANVNQSAPPREHAKFFGLVERCEPTCLPSVFYTASNAS